MQTTINPKKRPAKPVLTPEQRANDEQTDRVTLIAFYVMMGALAAALLYFLAMPIFL